MATEAPHFGDGAQTTAAANYYNPASALFGPGGSGQFLAVFLSAARVVTLQTAQGGIIYGLLQNTPAAGQAADVWTFPSIGKAVSGAAVTAGVTLMVDTNGRLIAWAGGAGNYVVGVAIEAAAAANAVFTVQLWSPVKPALT